MLVFAPISTIAPIDVEAGPASIEADGISRDTSAWLTEEVADMLLETGICTEGAAEILEVALILQAPVCVSALTSGVVERGNSPIAPKPSITLPYFNI